MREMVVRRVTSPLWWAVTGSGVAGFIAVGHWIGYGWAEIPLLAGVFGSVLVDRRLIDQQRRRRQ